ncbi:MAG: radical SAM protein [Succinivibrio sp.]|nr:radical SAM protein [Succinivibrio sp.]
MNHFKVLRNLSFGRPILTIYDVTKLCNQRCPMCNIWKTRSESLDLTAIEEQAKQLSAFGMGYVYLQGGEPTLRKDLIAIVDIFIKYGIKPTVLSNGILVKKELAEELAARPCNLMLSVDSLIPERFAHMRGRDSLQKVLDNVAVLRNIPHRSNWSVTTTVSAISELDDVLNIRQWALDNGFMHAIRPYVFVKGVAGAEVAELAADRQKVLNIFEHYIEIAKKENYLAYLVYREHIRYLKGESMPMCDAYCRSLLMKENGALAPCIEFPDEQAGLSGFAERYKELKPQLAACNRDTPCFYNDAREIGVLWRHKLEIALHLPVILLQLKRYGNFF